MRLLHPTTMRVITKHKEAKVVLAHAWSEVFKFKGQNKSHPKMFIKDDPILGIYLRFLYEIATEAGCNLDINKVNSLNHTILASFNCDIGVMEYLILNNEDLFNDNYLFSDACSLYYKGINIFPDIFGDDWRKYVPVESLKEVKRQVDKTLNKKQ